MKEMWVGYNVGCTMSLANWPSDGSMLNSYNFQPVGPWMGYSFTDLGAEGCCHSLNTLFLATLCLPATDIDRNCKSRSIANCFPTLWIFTGHISLILNMYHAINHSLYYCSVVQVVSVDSLLWKWIDLKVGLSWCDVLHYVISPW